MANPILQQLFQNQNPGQSVMMQAIGAMMRGESPQTFLQNLAKTNPQLQGLDLSGDLNKTAEQLYSQKGQDYNKAKADIRNNVNQFLK